MADIISSNEIESTDAFKKLDKFQQYDKNLNCSFFITLYEVYLIIELNKLEK